MEGVLSMYMISLNEETHEYLVENDEGIKQFLTEIADYDHYKMLSPEDIKEGVEIWSFDLSFIELSEDGDSTGSQIVNEQEATRSRSYNTFLEALAGEGVTHTNWQHEQEDHVDMLAVVRKVQNKDYITDYEFQNLKIFFDQAGDRVRG